MGLLLITPSVLKYKSFWHFARFIEHYMNLETIKYSQYDLYFRTEVVATTTTQTMIAIATKGESIHELIRLLDRLK